MDWQQFGKGAHKGNHGEGNHKGCPYVGRCGWRVRVVTTGDMAGVGFGQAD